MYSNVDKVRSISGFDNSSQISDATIRDKILMGDSMIRGAIGSKYLLPIKYHRQKTITFSGTGTGSGTMTITINAIDYTIAISSSLTASQAADLFRNSAINSAHFKTDRVGSGSVVRIVSITDSSNLTTADAEINVTAYATVQGISAAISEAQDAYPPYLEQLSAELATAQLLMDEYGVESEDSSKDGVQRYERIQKQLEMFQNDEDLSLYMRLFDEVTEEELQTVTDSVSGSVHFFPNDSSETDDTNPTASKIDINEQF